MAPAHGDPSAPDTNLLPQEQELTEAEVQIAAEKAWEESAHGGKLPVKPRPLTYGPSKAPVRDKKARSKARKRPSEILRGNPAPEQGTSQGTGPRTGANASAGAGAGYGSTQSRAARQAARAYTQNVQHAMHPISRASSDYNSVEHMGGTYVDPTAAVLAGAPPTLDFDPFSDEDLTPRIAEEAYPSSDADSFTSVSVELKRQPHLNAREIAAATAQAAAEAMQAEQGEHSQLSMEQRRQVLHATIDDAASEVEAANAAAQEKAEVFAESSAAEFASATEDAVATAPDSAVSFEQAAEQADTETTDTVEADADAAHAALAAAESAELAAIAAAEAGVGVNDLGLPADDRIGLVGQMTYPDIRQYDLVYVNKLKTIADLLNFGQVLLVRPHGFGVTFLLSLLECILGGYRQFVAGLENVDELRNIMVHPISVVRLDLGQIVIKLAYDEPAHKAYQEFKEAEQSSHKEHVATEEELVLQERFAQNEERLDGSRTLLWRLRNGYQEIHNRLDELNRICAMQQGVLTRSFALKDASEWTMRDLDLDPNAERSDGKSGAGTAQRTGSATSASSASSAASARVQNEDGSEGEAVEVTAELNLLPQDEAIPLLNLDDDDIVIPMAARPLVDALSLCEESLRLLQWQQQCLGLQIDLYLAKEHWLRCQMQLDLANEEDEHKKQQVRDAIDEMKAGGEDPEYIAQMLAHMEESPEVKKAHQRTAMAHMRVVAVSSHLEAIREVIDDSDLHPLKQLQSLINTLRQREAAGTAYRDQDSLAKQVPASVRPLMEEVALMSRLLRELQREWSKKRAAYGRLQKQQSELLTELKRLQQEQDLLQQQNAPSEQEMMEFVGQKQYLWEQERDRLVNELATAYYQQFYLALAQPTLPNQSEAVAAAYAAEADNSAASAASSANAAGASEAVSDGSGADAEAAGVPAEPLTPEQESEIIANTEVTLMNFEGLLTALIKEHAGRIQPCALLLDSYDAALTSVGDCPELIPPLQKLVEKMVNALRINQELFKHIFFMGTTDFSSNRVFFGFGRLVDISQLTNDLGSIVGFTEDELVTYFGPELEAAVERIEAQRRVVLHDPEYEYSLEELLDEMQEHYGNYTFASHGATPLFKTKEVLQFLQDRTEQYLFKGYL